MMRPVDAPGVVVADFQHPELPFDPGDAVWVIGGKWEQQFMGHDGDTETILPGAWLNLAGRWEWKAWDGWQVPVPLKRCHGCHTVGLDVEAGTFVEPNIGCESCHGRGEWHAQTGGLGRIYSRPDSEVCGQCHTRGTDPTGEYHFPVAYRPGEDLAEAFEPALPTPGQTSSYWWGNGRVRKRHQEYTAWQMGGHALSLERLREDYDGRYGEVTNDCLTCHAADYIFGRRRWRATVETVQEGVTCIVCHNVHGDLDQPRMGCTDCHEGGAYYHQPERNADHIPCPQTANVDCVDCHMPKTVTIGGEFAFHDHGPGIVPPADTEKWGTPSACANGTCHVAQAAEVLQASYERHYGGPAPSAN